jgi:hypothetical protein
MTGDDLAALLAAVTAHTARVDALMGEVDALMSEVRALMRVTRGRSWRVLPERAACRVIDIQTGKAI